MNNDNASKVSKQAVPSFLCANKKEEEKKEESDRESMEEEKKEAS